MRVGPKGVKEPFQMELVQQMSQILVLFHIIYNVIRGIHWSADSALRQVFILLH